MGLNKSKGNMYGFATHTWNTMKGECSHGCLYCYMGKWGKQPELRFDEKELKTDLGNGNYIFVGSSCDMWAKDIPDEWIIKTLDYCKKYNNVYLFQSKNPKRFDKFLLPCDSILCTTIETNRDFPKIFGSAPSPHDRSLDFACIPNNIHGLVDKMVTIEPIIDFDVLELVFFIKRIDPFQVNIGADSCNNNLPEPYKGKVLKLIEELEDFTTVHKKSNLNRILKQ